jgi:Protein of unknown function (DUF4232)
MVTGRTSTGQAANSRTIRGRPQTPAKAPAANAVTRATRHTLRGHSGTLAQASLLHPGWGFIVPVVRWVSVIALGLAICGLAASTAVGSGRSVRTCSLDSMTMQLGARVSEKTGGQETLPLVLTEHAGTTCVLDGYPSVALLDRSGRLIPFRYADNGDQMITGARPKPVTLHLGSSAYFALNKTGCQVHPTRIAKTLRIALPGSRRTTTIRPHQPTFDYCGRGFFARVAVSPIVRKGGWGCDRNSCQRRRK